ncbi:MAG: NAD-dependent epimerase [Spirulina sp.]
MKHILVTGVAGFIGFFVAQRLLRDGHRVYGIDNLNGYYDVRLKRDRLARLCSHTNLHFEKLDLADRQAVLDRFEHQHFDAVIHLAAQAGVRFSLEEPFTYCDSNLTGFLSILEGCRHYPVEHLIFASSSSVYGANQKVPFSVADRVDCPISLYAATKKANELMAHAYSHLYQIPATGLRFFTVYGPWGRPDMAYFKFADAIAQGRPIQVFNHGHMRRDFTYVDDVVEAILRLLDRPPLASPLATSPSPGMPLATASFSTEPLPEASTLPRVPYKIYNIGNHRPVELLYLIELIEAAMGQSAVKVMLPMQPGDVPITYADVEDLMVDTGFQPQTTIEDGIAQFMAWYKDRYCNYSLEQVA